MARMPAIFFGHGNPMNALRAATRTPRPGRASAATLPRPKAILAVSAHWYVPGTLRHGDGAGRARSTTSAASRASCYEVQYPAPGDRPRSRRACRSCWRRCPSRSTSEWGLDHGTWSVLVHVFPDADVPVVQLSIDETQPAAVPLRARRGGWPPLRDEGVLVIGSGNLVHNLHAYAWGRHPAEPFDWAVRFEQRGAGADRGAAITRPLVEYESLGRDAMLVRARRPTTTCRCSTCSAPASPATWPPSRWKASTAARCPC